ncbi:hypothetical protein AVEN_23769-1 [Araneus ventricosus]|uniref:Uncharacterized protein n=1 Tax=Araneus ventricosus TaxID=182803 RepID=A0A4Y2HN33_ARAVE|nr:hypothetical protein AVEN_23769-1 [Araneus ventricosus]
MESILGSCDASPHQTHCIIYGLIHHPWLNPDQRLKGNLHEQANADRNDRLDVSPNWRETRLARRLMVTQGLFWDKLHYFEPWSDDTRAITPLSCTRTFIDKSSTV